VFLARRIAEKINAIEKTFVCRGVLDITMYRDGLPQGAQAAQGEVTTFRSTSTA